MLRTSDLEYDLPAGRIAVRPAQPRDAARLMVVDRARGSIEHRVIRDLPDVLRPGDLMVTNESRVLPARFLGVREDTGGRVEGLYLREAGPRDAGRREAGRPEDRGLSCRWVSMVKARRFRPGARIALLDRHGRPSRFSMSLVERAGDGGGWTVEVRREDGRECVTPEVLETVGLPPIPPYILGARRDAMEQPVTTEPAIASPGAAADPPGPAALDAASYQTVFAGDLLPCGDGTEVGSVAAPTAGLHFTPDLLARLGSRGILRTGVVLHVGPGTFKPVEAEFVEDHPMHAEWCSMPEAARAAIVDARSAGNRVVCVGTTSARTVEAFAAANVPMHMPLGPRPFPASGPPAPPAWLHTRLLITPGYRFRATDALLTNFHLPRSTLMALVAAMLPGGVAELKRLYAIAIADGYRFYSYGDAMLIL